MAYHYDVTVSHWFSFSGSIEKVVSAKLLLLFISVGMAINAQLFVFPKIKSDNLKSHRAQIVAITVIGVAMLVLGSMVRIGGL